MEIPPCFRVDSIRGHPPRSGARRDREGLVSAPARARRAETPSTERFRGRPPFPEGSSAPPFRMDEGRTGKPQTRPYVLERGNEPLRLVIVVQRRGGDP